MNYYKVAKEAEEKYGLRKYQKESYISIREKFKKYESEDSDYPNLPLLLVMPTGTGKTLTAMSVCMDMLINDEIDNVVWVAHRYELLNQARRSCNLCCYIYYGKSREEYNEDEENKNIKNEYLGWKNKFKFIMRSSVKENLPSIKKSTLVVYDEAHHCVAKEYCLKDVKETGAKILGLTATPFRTETGTEPFIWAYTKRGTECGYSIDRERIKAARVEKINLSTAMMKGYLCKFDVYNVKKNEQAPVTEENDIIKNIILQEWEKMKIQDCSGNKKFLIYSKEENQEQKEIKIPKRSENGKILIYSRSAEGLYEKLVDRGISTGMLVSGNYKAAYYVNGEKHSISDREEIIKAFSNEDCDKKGSIKVLINNAILTEGFDEPKVTDIILLYNTQSHIRMTQIIGRGLRPYGDKERPCIIYDFKEAGVSEKVYKGNIMDLANNVGFDEKGNITSEQNKIVLAFPKQVMFKVVLNRKNKDLFYVAGVFKEDGLEVKFISKEEEDLINKYGEYGSKENKSDDKGIEVASVKLIFEKEFNEFLKKKRKNYIEKKEEKTFIEYLEEFGDYERYKGEELYDDNPEYINKCIESFGKKFEEDISKMIAEFKNGETVKKIIEKMTERNEVKLEDQKYYLPKLWDVLLEEEN